MFESVDGGQINNKNSVHKKYLQILLAFEWSIYLSSFTLFHCHNMKFFIIFVIYMEVSLNNTKFNIFD